MLPLVEKFSAKCLPVTSFLLFFLFAAQGLSAPGPRSRTAALGKVTWIAVSSRSQKQMLGQVRRITSSSNQPMVFVKRCLNRRDCSKKAARAGASVLLSARVEALGSTYLFRLRSRCLNGKRKVIEQRSACEVCTLPEAGRRLAKALVELAARTRRQVCGIQTAPGPRAGRLSVSTKTTTAVSPRPASRPRATTAAPTARATGSSTASRKSLSSTHRLGAKPRRAAIFKLGGWVLGGLALGAIAAGSVLMALDGKGTCSGSAECPKVYDFKAAGITSLTLGGAGLAAAATMVVLGYHWSRSFEQQVGSVRRPKHWMLTAALLPGGFTFGATGSF